MKPNRPFTVLAFLAIALLIVFPAHTQDDCDTFLGSITQKENDCAPCTNSMEKLLQPFQMKRDIDAQMQALQRAIDKHLDDRQDRIDLLMDMQGETDRVLREWGIGDLNGGPRLTKDGLPESQYLQNTIDDLKEFIKRFAGQTDWLNEMLAVFEQMMDLLKEAEKLKQQHDDLAEAIRNGTYGNLGDINYDCCPDAEFNPDEPVDLDKLLDDLAALDEARRDYRSRLADQIVAATESMISLLSQRAEEEKEATERRDQFADGLFALIGNKITEGISAGITSALEGMGYELGSTERTAIEAFANAVSTAATSTGTGGGLGGAAGSASSQIIDLALEGMSPADREAIAMISDAVLSEIASAVVDKAIGDAIKNKVANFLMKGAASGAGLPIMLFEKLVTVPLYLWAERDMLILRGGFDRILLGLLKSIRLMYVAVPASPYSDYVDALGTVTICLPEQHFDPEDPEAMKRALLEAAFPGKNLTTLGENERAEMSTDNNGIRFMEYMIPVSKYSNQRLRCKVRFNCYCGQKLKKIYTTEPANRPIKPEDIRSTGETIGPVAEATARNPYPDTVRLTIGPGLITSDSVHQAYIIPDPIVVYIPPLQSVRFPIEAVCVRDDLPPYPEGDTLTPIDTWIPVFPEDIPRGPEIYHPSTPLDVVNRPEEAAPIIYEITKDIIETIDSLSLIDGIPKSQLSGDKERERISFKQQVVWNEVAELENRPGRKLAFKENARNQISEGLGRPYSDLPTETQEQVDVSLEEVFSIIVLIGEEAKDKPRNPAPVTEPTQAPPVSERDCPCEASCSLGPIRVLNVTHHTELTASAMHWHDGDPNTRNVQLQIPIPTVTNPCPDDCDGDQLVEVRLVPQYRDARLNTTTEWSDEPLTTDLLGPGEIRVEVRYTCFCDGETCAEQTALRTIRLTEPNDCCDTFRDEQDGRIRFAMNNGQSVEISGNTLRVRANGVDQTFELNYNIEALFCHLGDEQIIGALVQTASSRSSEGGLDEQHSSSDMIISHTSDPTSGAPHYKLTFSQTVNGREFQISISIDEERCIFDVSGLVNNQILEHAGPPIYTPSEFRRYLDRLFRSWRDDEVFIAQSENDAVLRRWLQSMFFAYLQLQKAADDPSYDQVARQWRSRLVQALEFELNNQGVSPHYKPALRALLNAVQQNADSIEIVRAFFGAAF
ncbi:MAG: hypothetical protein R3301_05485 [Saprospiraceae bacterium]|nr:hypothetical protein [Saprospiraceae bacterium]